MTNMIIDCKQSKMLSIILLNLAKRQYIRCKRRRVTSNDTLQSSLPDILEILILVSTALEAFINEYCYIKIEDAEYTNDYDQISPLLNRLMDRDIEVRLKWQLIPRLLWQRHFNEDSNPWQNFNVLIHIRNDILHYKGRLRSPTYSPNYLNHIRQLMTRRPQINTDDVRHSSFCWIDRLCNMKIAKWAFNTGIYMIQQLLEFGDDETKDLYQWMMNAWKIRLISDRNYGDSEV